MAQRQNTFAALLAALSLAPQFVHSAEQSGMSSADKHANVKNGIVAVAQIGGALAAAQNPLYGALIDAAIKAAVGIANQDNFAPPAPIAMVPILELPETHPIVQGAAGGMPVIGNTGPSSAPASATPQVPKPEGGV